MVEFVLQLDGLGLRQMGIELGGGALIGGIIGFAAKKVAKVIAVIIGLQLALFKFLETRGVMQVNWDAISGGASNASQTAGDTASGESAPWLESLLSAVPVSAGFTGGFLVGFKKG